MCIRDSYTEGFDIAAVYTKPDTPKNRGMKLIASEVKTYAQSVGLPVYQPETFRDDAVVEAVSYTHLYRASREGTLRDLSSRQSFSRP